MQDRMIEIMMRLIRCAIAKEPVPDSLKPELSDRMLESLFLMSRFYDLAHLLDFAFENSNFQYRSDIQARFQTETLRAVYRYDAFSQEIQAVSKAFEEAKIQYVLLKGTELRNIYPEPWMRTSCDIDVLVAKGEIEHAAKILSGQLGYKSNLYTTHDISFLSPNNVHIELHFDLSKDNDLEKADRFLADIWAYTIQNPGQYQAKLTNEMLYVYHLAHMAKHFKNGGCGVRPVLDLWLLRQNEEFRTASLQEFVRRAGLADFSAAVENLSEVWFGTAEHNQTTRMIERYIFSGNKYSGAKNKLAISEVQKGRAQEKKKIWKPYAELKFWYPALARHKCLLPFYQIKRWVTIFFGMLKSARNVRKMKKKMSAQKIAESVDLMKLLGI